MHTLISRTSPYDWHRRIYISIVLIGVFSSGCASLSLPAKQATNPHQVVSAQRAKAEDVLKPLPEMTVRDYEAAGDQYRQQGEMAMAFLQYNKALRLAPDDLSVRYKKGRLFLQKGLITDAIQSFEGIIKQHETYALAHAGLGEAYFRIPSLKKAEQSCRRATELDETLWYAYNCLGMIYDRQKRFQEAIFAYQSATQLQPQQAILLNNIGLSYYAQGKYENALDAFHKALSLENKNTKIYNNLGVILSKLGRYEEALAIFAKGGDQAQAHNNLGVMYLADGHYQEAISSFEKAIAIHPTYYEKASQNLTLARRALATSSKGHSTK
ncbi:tetratricopeptide repeat protein [Candidatus Entotheonella palauensis]|uniref:tetratricopeptide repeat protein n=1 Tax=Candidatus Entotheonella palauensis TaxID=93172 RepID=UPI000B7F8570|nr:tetratricopeptide repeat protein [Candidatus Entotheonella palauensis]